MPPRRKKHPALQLQDDEVTPGRASSLRVNLSYVSNLSDSGNGSFGSPRDTRGTSCRSARVSPERETLGATSEMELALGRSCRLLKEAIMNKTREIFKDSGDELAWKTATILNRRSETSMERNNYVNSGGKHRKMTKKPVAVDPSRTLKSSSRIWRGDESLVLGASNNIIKARSPMVKLSRLRDPGSVLPIDSNVSGVSNVSSAWEIGAPLTCSSFIGELGNSGGLPFQRAGTELAGGNLRSPLVDNAASCISLRGRNIPRTERTTRRLTSDETIPMELTSVQSHMAIWQSGGTVRARRTSLSVNTSRNLSSRSSEPNVPINVNDGVGGISLRVNTSLETEKTTSEESTRTNPRSNGTIISDSDSMDDMSLVARLRNLSRGKMRSTNGPCAREGGPSFVEGTPYPPGRSILRKTQIRSETMATRNRVDSSTRNFADTLGNNSSDPRALRSDLSRGVSRDTRENDAPAPNGDGVLATPVGKSRRKRLLPLRDNFEIVSLSPVSCQSETSRKNPPTWKPRRCFRKRKSRRAVAEKRMQALLKDTEDEDDEGASRSVPSVKKPEEQPRVKKKRKVLSKKIVVKKIASEHLGRLYAGRKNEEQSTAGETSWGSEFLKKKKLSVATRDSKLQRLVIVATGFSKGDADLIKSIAGELGGAEINSTVTRRTTHVVSTGVRTINLLRGIIRGCWMVNLNWVLESLERGRWLDAERYEMVHFSKAVQENRRDRQIFGNSYVPELFTTCGPIYVEHGSTPPPCILKELVKTAGGRIAEDPRDARLSVGPNGLREIWVLDSITTGDLQPIGEYRQK